jgi:hypothetical protein
MASEESVETRLDRLKKRFQDSILENYPNPERKGCPGDAVLRALAARPPDPSIERDPNWHHLTHCSECYREFLGFIREFRAEAVRRWARVQWASVAAAVVFAVVLLGAYQGWVLGKRPQNADLAWVKTTVDIPAVLRSGEAGDQKPIVLERKRQELTVQLPLGNEPGEYQLQLKQGSEVRFRADGKAELRDGVAAFTVPADWTKLKPGRYTIVVRHVPFDWNYFPVELE